MVNTMGRPDLLGKPLIMNQQAAPWTYRFTGGFAPGSTFTIQGIIIDQGSLGKGISLTNAIILKIEDGVPSH